MLEVLKMMLDWRIICLAMSFVLVWTGLKECEFSWKGICNLLMGMNEFVMGR